MTMKLLPIILCMALVWTVQAQQMSWKKHANTAEKLYKEAHYADAAYHFEQAWRQKTKKKDLIHKAGECYYIVKDYRKAADAFGRVKNDLAKFPLAGLKYARCLKQDGQFEAANTELRSFINKYNGKDAAIVKKIVETEILGCELGLKTINKPSRSIELEHLNSGINTPEAEFAPLSFADDVLYFSSTVGNKAKIYRSQRQNGLWSKAALPENFPTIENEHYCNGTLTPDGQRFYFTICQSIENWGNLTTRCEIYVTKRAGDVWTPPEKLRDYINLAGATATHPFVMHKDDKEYLFFSSNREGGQGGMDLWFTTKDINSEDLDFTFPENLGATINTIGDEVTPFYNMTEGTLYFASNGLATIGGFDIFKSTGNEKKWTKAENLKTPINSPADDRYFINNTQGTRGFLVSNRLFGMEKITTQHEDIFSFTQVTEDLLAEGKIYDKQSGDLMKESLVSLYEITEDGRDRLLFNKSSTDGSYSFRVLPNRKFKIEVTANDYYPSSFNFDTYDFANTSVFGKPIYAEKIEAEGAIANTPTVPTTQPPVPITTPSNEVLTTSPPPTTTTSPEKAINQSPSRTYPSSSPNTVPTTTTNSGTYTTRGRSARDNYEIVTASPRHTGTYYKVQIIAVAKYNENHKRYNPVRDLGRLDTEYIVKKKLTRVLLADYFSYDEAERILRQAQQNGFSGAYIIKYEDGERMGRVRT